MESYSLKVGGAQMPNPLVYSSETPEISGVLSLAHVNYLIT